MKYYPHQTIKNITVYLKEREISFRKRRLSCVNCGDPLAPSASDAQVKSRTCSKKCYNIQNPLAGVTGGIRKLRIAGGVQQFIRDMTCCRLLTY